jgi:PIN domain nuclease of toxin-antitoxin system
VYGEPGAAKIIAELHSGEVEPLLSAVNLCEVQTRLLRDGLPFSEVTKLLAGLELAVVPFDVADADGASALYIETQPFGLSLGDRACLALTKKQKVTVWTADKVWKKLKVDVPVELIRI